MTGTNMNTDFYVKALTCLARKIHSGDMAIIIPTADSTGNSPDLLAGRPSHFHESWEIKALIQGRMNCYFAHQQFLLNARQLLIIPPGCRHNITCPADLEKNSVWFTMPFELGEVGVIVYDRRRHVYYLTTEQRAMLSALLGRAPADVFYHVYQLTAARPSNLMRQAGANALHELFLLLSEVLAHPEPANQHPAPLVQKALSFMKTMYYTSSLKIKDIADYAGLSPVHLAFLFRKATGLSIRKTLIQIRLDLAYQHLQTGRYSVKEVAYSTGWNNQLYFSNSFKKKFGFSPSQTATTHHRRISHRGNGTPRPPLLPSPVEMAP